MTEKAPISCDIEDFLTEDPIIHNQKYFVFTYILPDPKKNELEVPLFKMRGAYKTIAEAEKRCEKLIHLGGIDKYLSNRICEVGKFGGLYSDEEIRKQGNVDIKYRETLMNDMVRQRLENEQFKDNEFEDRRLKMKEQAALESGKLAEAKPITVSLGIKGLQNQIEDLENRLKIAREDLEKYNEVYAKFSKEEIEDSELAYNEHQKELKKGVPSSYKN